MLETTGCDFVMIGRGALGNPWIFRELLGGPAPDHATSAARWCSNHFRAHVAFVGEAAGARCAASASTSPGTRTGSTAPRPSAPR